MALSRSIQAYQDCLDFMEKCLEYPTGGRMWFRSDREAEFWRMRCNQARKLDREQNSRMHGPDDPRFGVSPFDTLMFVIKESSDGFHWVYGQRMILDTQKVEPIPDEEVTMIATDVPLAIEDHTESEV